MSTHNPTNRGFTLIEIIVSLAVFIVVATIAVGAFLKILDANKQSQALETAMNNANFALDSMVRDMRVGYGYDCYNDTLGNAVTYTSKTACNGANLSILISGSSTPTVYPTIAFYSSQSPSGWSCTHPAIHAYRFNPVNGLIEKSEESSCTDTSVGDSSSTFYPLTASSSTFKIQSFAFSVDAASGIQPKVFIYLKAFAGSNLQNETSFTVQSTVAQRIMNGQ